MNEKTKQKQEVSRSNCRRVGRRTPSNYKDPDIGIESGASFALTSFHNYEICN
jgi:hypothetical protein